MDTIESTHDYLKNDAMEYLGVATARYCNVLEMDDKHIIFPTNSELHIWKFDYFEQEPTENAKEDQKEAGPKFEGKLVFKQSVASANIQVLKQSDTAWVGITYDGEIIVIRRQSADKIIANQSFEEITRYSSDHWFIRDGAVNVNTDFIAFITEAHEDHA